MKATVRIAQLKSRLSEHLRSVRKGRTLTVLDRDTPIARIVPYAAAVASSDGAELPADAAWRHRQ